MVMLLIFLSFNAIYALVPLVVIAILILAAAGITRGKNVFEIFGFGTLFGFAQEQAGKGLAKKQEINLKGVKLFGWTGASLGPATRTGLALDKAGVSIEKGTFDKVKGYRSAKKDATVSALENNPAIKAAMTSTGEIRPDVFATLKPKYQKDLHKHYTKLTNLSTKLSESQVIDQAEKMQRQKEEKGYAIINPVTLLHHGKIAPEQETQLKRGKMNARYSYLTTLAKALKERQMSIPAYASASGTVFDKQLFEQDINRHYNARKQADKQKKQQYENEAKAKRQIQREKLRQYLKSSKWTKVGLISPLALIPVAIAIPVLLPIAVVGGIGATTATRWRVRSAMNNAKKAKIAQASPPKAPVSPAQSTQVNTPPLSQPRIYNREWLNLQKMRLQQNLQNISNPDWLKRQAQHQFRNVEIPSLTDPAWQSRQLASIKAGMSDIRKGLPFTPANIKGSYNAFKVRYL